MRILFLREPRRKTLVTVAAFRGEQAGALGLQFTRLTLKLFSSDRHNERYEELNAHPDWSFHSRDFPGRALHEARNRVIARHPDAICLFETRSRFSDLDIPNTSVEIGALNSARGAHTR